MQKNIFVSNPTKPVYFGGSRSLPLSPKVITFITKLLVTIPSVNVGCQLGADQAVIIAARTEPKFINIFAVAQELHDLPYHCHFAHLHNPYGKVFLGAGGSSVVPVKARYLRRSKSAFNGCHVAVFFKPGAGSLAVIREAIKASIPVFAFSQTKPGQIPSTSGSWVHGSFNGRRCWSFQPDQG